MDRRTEGCCCLQQQALFPFRLFCGLLQCRLEKKKRKKEQLKKARLHASALLVPACLPACMAAVLRCAPAHAHACTAAQNKQVLNFFQFETLLFKVYGAPPSQSTVGEALSGTAAASSAGAGEGAHHSPSGGGGGGGGGDCASSASSFSSAGLSVRGGGGLGDDGSFAAPMKRRTAPVVPISPGK
jgi:hypothetical protein